MSTLETFAKKQSAVQGAVSPTCTVRVALNVERAAGILDVSVDELRAAVSVLEDIINPLLGSPVPPPGREECSTSESEFADRILRHATEVESLTYRIRALTARLQ